MNEFLVVAISIVSAWLGLFVITPKLFCSISRHTLWRLRDKIADAIIGEEISKSRAAYRLLDRVETLILHADKLKVGTLLFMPEPPKQWIKEREAQDKKFVKELTDGDADQLKKFEAEFHMLMATHMLATSPFGWFILITTILVIIPVAIIWRSCSEAIQWAQSELQGLTSNRFDVALEKLGAHGNHGLESCN